MFISYALGALCGRLSDAAGAVDDMEGAADDREGAGGTWEVYDGAEDDIVGS